MKTFTARINEVDRQSRESIISWQERVRLLNEIAPGIGNLSGYKKQGGLSYKLKANAPRIHHQGGR